MTAREKFEAWLTLTHGKSFLNHAESPALWGGDATKHDVNPFEHPWTRGAWEGYQAALASQQPSDDGWFEWAGGEISFPKDWTVEFKLRSGSRGSGVAENYWWHHDGGGYDIIAYRVVKP